MFDFIALLPKIDSLVTDIRNGAADTLDKLADVTDTITKNLRDLSTKIKPSMQASADNQTQSKQQEEACCKCVDKLNEGINCPIPKNAVGAGALPWAGILQAILMLIEALRKKNQPVTP